MPDTVNDEGPLKPGCSKSTTECSCLKSVVCLLSARGAYRYVVCGLRDLKAALVFAASGVVPYIDRKGEGAQVKKLRLGAEIQKGCS